MGINLYINSQIFFFKSQRFLSRAGNVFTPKYCKILKYLNLKKAMRQSYLKVVEEFH